MQRAASIWAGANGHISLMMLKIGATWRRSTWINLRISRWNENEEERRLMRETNPNVTPSFIFCLFSETSLYLNQYPSKAAAQASPLFLVRRECVKMRVCLCACDAGRRLPSAALRFHGDHTDRGDERGARKSGHAGAMADERERARKFHV